MKNRKYNYKEAENEIKIYLIASQEGKKYASLVDLFLT